MCVTTNLISAATFCLLLVAFSVAEEMNVNTVLQDLRQELRYETLLVLYNSSEYCPSNLKLQTLEVPLLLLASPTSFYLKQQMNSRMLALVCLGESLDQDEALLKALYVNLQHMRKTPTLLLLQRPMTERLMQIFVDCQQHKMLNVLALSSEDQQLYSYRAFPRFQLQQEALLQRRDVYFRNQLKDLGGYGIRTMPDRIMPRSVVYNDSVSGQPRIAGYVVKLIQTFADTLNATLNVRWSWNNQKLYMLAISNLSYDDKLDLPISLSDLAYTSNPLEHSYPIELSKWRLMLPLESELPINQMYFMIYRWQTVLLIVVTMLLMGALVGLEQLLQLGVTRPLNCLDQALRSYLGQSYPLPRRLTFTCALLGWQMAQYGVVLSSIYVAYLQMLYSDTPTEPEVRSYDDLRRSRRKIFMFGQELKKLMTLGTHNWYQNNTDLFQMTSIPSQFHLMRNTLNSSYVYPVYTSTWTMFEQIQSKLRRPHFRVSEQFVWQDIVPFALAVEQNSIYTEVLNEYLGRVKVAGLLEHWMMSSYFEMVQLRELPFYQVELPYVYRDMIWQDFRFIWLGYALFSALSCAVFVGEMLRARYRSNHGAV